MFGKFCLRVLVGTLVVCLFGGAGVLAAAVICTAGVGLIVVIPGTYLVGLLCTIWFIPFGDRREDSKEQDRRSPQPNHEQPAKVEAKHSLQRLSALQAYVAAAEATGRDWDTIRQELISAGWDEQTIASAWWRLNQIEENDY